VGRRHSETSSGHVRGQGGGVRGAHLGLVPVSVQGTDVREPGCTPASAGKRRGARRSQRRDAAVSEGRAEMHCAKSNAGPLVLPSHGGRGGGQ